MENIIMPLFGGILIGLASSVVLLGLGKIAGVSGVFASSFLVNPSKAESWKYFFIIGLVFGGLLIKLSSPELFSYDFLATTPLTILAGVLVGVGTRLGSGCTSGHGVCGLPRKSARSLTATLTFMGFGIITVFIRGLL